MFFATRFTLMCYDKALALHPDYVDAHNNRGNVMRELKQYRAALESYDKAIALQPQNAETYFNRAGALQDMHELAAALEDLDTAIALDPDNADAKLSKSLALLLSGDFENGFPLYEWRWSQAGTHQYKRYFKQPLWLGQESLKNKTILLHGEQGMGDNIQFCRYAQEVAALGATVILEVPAPLMSLMQGLPGVSQLVEHGQALPDFDYHCPLLSLPLACHTRLNTIPSANAYLHSDAGKRAAWASKLGPQSKPRVGLVWTGNIEHRNDHNRSLSLSTLLAQLPAHCDYISLQQEVRDEDMKALTGHARLRHFGDDLHDFSDTAALCDLMDLVISVDTSVAHLSGALGKPTWVLLPYAPDWRWLLQRDDSPWYASLKLYRQDADWAWPTLLKRVSQDLQQLGGSEAAATLAADTAEAKPSAARGLFASIRGALGLGR